MSSVLQQGKIWEAAGGCTVVTRVVTVTVVGKKIQGSPRDHQAFNAPDLNAWPPSLAPEATVLY